ncbi:MAG: HEAT repeat domain-containing protein [Planctomycetes bacterium]|nr:HEAT repeat domain-containing protein [Planctomycetota bacterium]
MWQIFIHSPDANDSQVTEAIQPLLQCAQESGDGHEDGVYALGTLREFGPRAANTIPDLIQLLHHPSSGTRAAAASALSKVGGSKTQQVTSALMNAEWGEPDPSVRSIEEQTINALTFRGQGASPSRH